MSWCCPFLPRWRGPSTTGRAAHPCPVTFPFLSPSRLWTAKEASGCCSLFHAQRAASAAAFPSVPPASRTKARPAGALCPLPAAPRCPRLTSRRDELCMAHRYSAIHGEPCGFGEMPSARFFPMSPIVRVTSQHFPCPFSASPDFGVCAVSHSGCRCLHTSTLFRHPVALGKQSLGGCLLAEGTQHRWVVPRELNLLGTGGTCWFPGS